MQTVHETGHDRSRVALLGVAIFALAVVTGLPAINGGFLSGDDYHLVRSHVLVNHPSLMHALKLFTIVHRDLYQPVPLLSFSLDFAVINALGLHPVAGGPDAGAWVFHLTNIVIHAVNAVLVLLVIKRLANRISIAAIAAAIFAVHPLAAEPVAWLNGRMMMLSTCFTLATLISLDRWDHKPTTGRRCLPILFAMLAHMSKISVALPILALILPLAQRRRPRRQWWVMWGVLAIITILFTAFAVFSSGEMFERAEDEMSGPPAIYVLLALGQYFRQYVMPIGLSAWYPPPPDISWMQPLVIGSAVTALLVCLIALVMARRTRIGLLGLLWFFAAVAPTLPIVPARRAVAADRYVYLPNVGLHWIAAAALVALFVYVGRKTGRTGRGSTWPVPLAVASAAAGIALMATAWHAQAFYRNNITLAHRIIQCDPDYPSVYESAAWAYYREGRYEEAIPLALEDLKLHPQKMACEVYQVVGMSQFRLGRYDDALASLEKAIQADPEYGKCYTRLGKIQAHLGRYDDAIASFERGVEIMPYYNPGLLNLASIYRTVGRLDDAVHTYNLVLAQNHFDVTAHLALAEIDIQHQRFGDALGRLRKLLGWMPENTIARTNLGLVHESLDQPRAAMDAYTMAIRRDPHAVVAIVNLASLYIRHDRASDAQRLMDAHLADHADNLTYLITYHDSALHLNRPDRAAEALLRARNRMPTDAVLGQWTAYALAQANRTSQASHLLHSTSSAHPGSVLPLLTQTLVALQTDSPDKAIANVNALVAVETPTPSNATDRLIADLEHFATAHPDNPWPYYLTAVILVDRDKPDLAKLVLEEFARLCPTADCQSRADRLLPQIPAQPQH